MTSMLVVDIDTLRPVHTLHLAHEVVLHVVASANEEQLLRADRAFADLVAGADVIPVTNLDL